MERLTKIVLLLATLAAASLPAWQTHILWWWFVPLTTAAFLVGVIAGRSIPQQSAVIPLMFGFITPALGIAILHTPLDPFHWPWMFFLLGVFVASPGATRWHVPVSWRIPAALWVICMAISVVLVAIREIDFNPAVWWRRDVPSLAGLPPAFVIGSAGAGFATFGLGVLWLDWLFEHFTGRNRAFTTYVVVPAAASAATSILIGAYQGFVDISWWNWGIWTALRRAGGGLYDANSFGVLAAVWGALGFALLDPVGSRARALARAIWAVVSCAAVWGSGSRTAFVTAVVGAMFIAASASKEWHARSGRRAVWAAVAVVLLVAAALTAAVLTRRGPVGRMVAMVPDASPRGVAHVAAQLWSRNSYGTAAVRMIAEHPWFGIGATTFNLSVRDVARSLGKAIPADNAQNWFRHQIAELGIIGSIGWICWVAVFATTWRRRRSQIESSAVAAAVEGALVGIVLVSLVGMPTQNPAVLLTFWLLVFWPSSSACEEYARLEHRRALWTAALAICVVFAVGTAYDARQTMRAPFRAAQFDREYRYGFHFDSPGLGWTDDHAVYVPQSSKPWLKLTYWIEHPDAATHPVRVQIWRDHDRIVNRRLYNDVRVTKYVSVPGAWKRFVLEVKVDRTFRPRDDAPERGMNLEWEFVDTAPPGEP